MRCKWCNSEIEDDAKVCPYCKAIVHTSNATSGKNYVEEYLKIHKDNPSYNIFTNNKLNKKNNSIANALGIIGKVTIVLGIIACILCLFSEDFEEHILSIPFLVASLISGCTFLGFAEIIQLLQDIKDKME